MDSLYEEMLKTEMIEYHKAQMHLILGDPSSFIDNPWNEIAESQRVHQMSLSASAELSQLYHASSKDNFCNLFSTAIIDDTAGRFHGSNIFSLLEQVEEDEQNKPKSERAYIEKLKTDYFDAVHKFSLQYLASISSEIPIASLIKFVSKEIAQGELSKELVEKMTYSPDAPQEFRNKVLTSTWKGVNSTDMMISSKRWYDIPLPFEDLPERLQELETQSLADNIESASNYFDLGLEMLYAMLFGPPEIIDSIKKVKVKKWDCLIFKNISDEEEFVCITPHWCFFRATLCVLTIPGINYDGQKYMSRICAVEKIILHKYIEEDKSIHDKSIGCLSYFSSTHIESFLQRLYTCDFNNDLNMAQKIIDNYNREVPEEIWTNKMLTKFKAQIKSPQ